MLIKPSGIEGVPRIQFGHDTEMNKPVGLQRLPESFRCVCWYVPANFGDFPQFFSPASVVFVRPQLLGLFRVSLCEPDHSVRGDRHRAKFLTLAMSLGIVQQIQSFQTSLNVLLQVE